MHGKRPENYDICEACKGLQKQAKAELKKAQAIFPSCEKGRTLFCKFVDSELINDLFFLLRFLNLHTNEMETLVGMPDIVPTLERIPPTSSILLVEFIYNGTIPVLGPMTWFDDSETCKGSCQKRT